MKWMKELPSALWALRMTPNRAMSHTLFFLVYDSEVMLPTRKLPRGGRVNRQSNLKLLNLNQLEQGTRFV
jgi:hypothetical protein